MIRLIQNAYLDRDKYDLCINRDDSELIYALSWYLDTVCENWDVLVLDDYTAVWPLPRRRKWGITYCYRPYAVQQLGIFSKRPLSGEEVAGFVEKLPQVCTFAEVYLNADNPSLPEAPPYCQYLPQRNLVLRLERNYQEIYEGYHKNLRRNLRKSADMPWQIFEHDSPDTLIAHFARNKGADLPLSKRFYRDLQKVMYASLHRGCGHLWTLYGEGNQLLAGIFVLEFRGKLTLLFSSTSREGKTASAMPYLLNEYLIINSDKYRYFDFEGSNNDGLARFYQSFGARPETYYFLRYNGLPRFLKWLK